MAIGSLSWRHVAVALLLSSPASQDSVLPSSTTELAPSAPADVTPTVPDTDASLQAGSNEALPETTEVNGPVVVVNPPALVVNPPAVVVNPPAATAAGPAGAAAVHAAAPPETVELVGRVKVLEGKVHSLTEALEAWCPVGRWPVMLICNLIAFSFLLLQDSMCYSGCSWSFKCCRGYILSRLICLLMFSFSSGVQA